jgi:hypothetical protein
MPGGKRSDHISPRDVDILDFIARFGVVPRSAVARWAGTGRTATIGRETRLRKAELIRVVRAYGATGPLALCTPAGLRASGRRELRAARISASAISHDTVVAELAAELERGGAHVLSEREILARERAAGDRHLSARLSHGSHHRADLIRLGSNGEPDEAIEVELSMKAAARLDELLRAWRHAVLEKRVSRVTYHCSARTMPWVSRAVQRTRTEGVVSVLAL